MAPFARHAARHQKISRGSSRGRRNRVRPGADRRERGGAVPTFLGQPAGPPGIQAGVGEGAATNLSISLLDIARPSVFFRPSFIFRPTVFVNPSVISRLSAFVWPSANVCPLALAAPFALDRPSVLAPLSPLCRYRCLLHRSLLGAFAALPGGRLLPLRARRPLRGYLPLGGPEEQYPVASRARTKKRAGATDASSR